MEITRYFPNSILDEGYVITMSQIYDILLAGENVVKSVVRVPSPDVPVDKLESEVSYPEPIISACR